MRVLRMYGRDSRDHGTSHGADGDVAPRWRGHAIRPRRKITRQSNGVPVCWRQRLKISVADEGEDGLVTQKPSIACAPPAQVVALTHCPSRISMP